MEGVDDVGGASREGQPGGIGGLGHPDQGGQGGTGGHGGEGQKGDKGDRGPRGKPETNPLVKAGSWAENVRFVAAMFLLLAIAGLLFQVINQRSDDQRMLDLIEQGNEQRKAIKAETELIEDCVTPDGECFARGQERTADAVASINIVTQYAVICGEQEDGEKAILDCVNREVKAYLADQQKE